jgi:hypothetical protein
VGVFDASTSPPKEMLWAGDEGVALSALSTRTDEVLHVAAE